MLGTAEVFTIDDPAILKDYGRAGPRFMHVCIIAYNRAFPRALIPAKVAPNFRLSTLLGSAAMTTTKHAKVLILGSGPAGYSAACTPPAPT
jgi:hypothetical protein